MGTRGIMGIRINGQDRFSYNHFDSCPDGLGDQMVAAVASLLKAEGLEGFRKLAESLTVYNSEINPSAKAKRALKPYTDITVSNKSDDDWYCLTRGLQGDLEKTLRAGYIDNATNFINCSLFCEWAYVVNLDEEKFEVYEGCQKSPGEGRYAKNPGADGYFPCSLVAEFPLSAIPKDWKEKLPKEED